VLYGTVDIPEATGNFRQTPFINLGFGELIFFDASAEVCPGLTRPIISIFDTQDWNKGFLLGRGKTFLTVLV